MAFRGDIQGGQQANPLAGAFGGMGGGGQGTAGIEKNMSWKLLFFAGACCTTAAGGIALFILLTKFAPCSFMSNIFLLFFGFLMIILDFPIPHPQGRLMLIRDNIYKFLLLLTRFTGRGLWYLFLSSMVFVALHSETQESSLVGVVLSAYLLILGIASTVKGVMLSRKLNVVRDALASSGRANDFIGGGQSGLSKEQFAQMVTNCTNDHNMFTPDDLTTSSTPSPSRPTTTAWSPARSTTTGSGRGACSWCEL